MTASQEELTFKENSIDLSLIIRLSSIKPELIGRDNQKIL